jgi:hypothetical protein
MKRFSWRLKSTYPIDGSPVYYYDSYDDDDNGDQYFNDTFVTVEEALEYREEMKDLADVSRWVLCEETVVEVTNYEEEVI